MVWRTWRHLVRGVVVCLAVLAVSGAAGGGRKPAPTVGGVPVLALPPSPRVLLFAPHPDDETLAAGGLIRHLTARHVPVRVVFVTSGDGYPDAVREGLHTPKPTDSDYVAFGEARQREALAAATHLGLGPNDVRFLGFPDGGLADLWREHWSRSRPFTSPYTKEESPPYPNTVNPDVDYDGQDLTSVVTRVLRDFRPNVVIIPHPYDFHLDHAHTSYFAIEAIDTLQTRHVLASRLLVLTYVVHEQIWPPSPKTPADPMPPPGARWIPDTRWWAYALTPEELAAKTAALEEYKSQLDVMSDFLRKFLHRSEVFGRVKSEVLARIAAQH
jgi:LmbE family N-acetylglucosaminyl deacetylase